MQADIGVVGLNATPTKSSSKLKARKKEARKHSTLASGLWTTALKG